MIYIYDIMLATSMKAGLMFSFENGTGRDVDFKNHPTNTKFESGDTVGIHMKNKMISDRVSARLHICI